MVNKKTYIKERIKKVADLKGISYKKMFEIIKMSESSFKGEHIKKPINSNAIVNLITTFPDIDLYELFTGEKKYKQNDVVNMAKDPKSRNDYKEKYFECTENYMKLNEELKKLKKSGIQIFDKP